MNPIDIIYCEASDNKLTNLILYSYYHAIKDGGINSLSSPVGSCIISGATNCARLILYLNLSYYDHHDDASTIPVCAFTRAGDNSECFCICLLYTSDAADE